MFVNIETILKDKLQALSQELVEWAKMIQKLSTELAQQSKNIFMNLKLGDMFYGPTTLTVVAL